VDAIKRKRQQQKTGCTDHYGEDTLFHFASIFCPQNDHLHTLKVNLDGGGRAHALGEAVGGELAGIVDDKVGLAKVGQLLFGWSDKHVVLNIRISQNGSLMGK
jgi:hypothetical protein